MGHKGGQSKVNDACIVCTAKGTSWDEATTNSETIKPVALAVIELCLPGIRTGSCSQYMFT